MSTLVPMQCPKCGAHARAGCNCGVVYVSAGERAAGAVAANPEKSNRAIAADIGVGSNTVRRARPVAPDGAPEKRTGRDGKNYPAIRTASGKPLDTSGFSIAAKRQLAGLAPNGGRANGVYVKRHDPEPTAKFTRITKGLHKAEVAGDLDAIAKFKAEREAAEMIFTETKTIGDETFTLVSLAYENDFHDNANGCLTRDEVAENERYEQARGVICHKVIGETVISGPAAPLKPWETKSATAAKALAAYEQAWLEHCLPHAREILDSDIAHARTHGTNTNWSIHWDRAKEFMGKQIKNLRSTQTQNAARRRRSQNSLVGDDQTSGPDGGPGDQRKL
jgi:hypothetical protein